MSNLIELQVQIEKLQKQADDIRTKEFDTTVREIRAKMAAFGISLSDLRSVGSKKSVSKKGARSQKAVAKKAGKGNKGAKVAPKYRGPAGETWSGRGLAPKWLTALVAAGRRKDEFAL